MAARTGASVGVAVTITILGAMSLGFFVTTMVFYGNSQSALSELAAAEEANKEFVSPQEREHAAIRSIRDEATRERKTVVGYLATNKSELMQVVSGDSSMGMAELRERLTGVEGSEGSSLIGLVDNLYGQIDTLNEQLSESESERRAAQSVAENEAARVQNIENDFEDSAAGMQQEVQAIADAMKQQNDGINRTEQLLRDETAQVRSELGERISSLTETAESLDQDNRQLQIQIARLLGEGGVDRPMPLNEEALVDGLINQLNPIDNEVVLSIGRDKKAVLGMTFAVYDNPTDIRLNDETGEYPRGKAVVEIVRVEQTFSRARIIESSQGNPIVRGDVIANAVYDPTKTYKFVVDGLFDTDGDGIASRFERDAVEALIERWGGILVTEISGDVDFVVLGAKPVLPPQPGPGAPVATIQEYVRLQQERERYDNLLLRAEATSMPLLNANRLQTLIGDYPG
jgi:predicted metal-dependent hydrolase